jgi:ATP-dependent DNA ligase
MASYTMWQPAVIRIIASASSSSAKPYHDYFIFELKMDGFRALAYVEANETRLVSRNGSVFIHAE